jgi:hypothetical protein
MVDLPAQIDQPVETTVAIRKMKRSATISANPFGELIPIEFFS